MSADTDNRDQPDVQHRATASDADTPGRPDAIESDRRVKMQAALRGAATRTGAIGRYLWAEFRATTMATASQTWRLVRYGIASARLSMSRRTLRRAHLALAEKLYQVGSGDPAMRDAVRKLDEQIKTASEAKRSTSKLVAERREQLIHLSESSASTGGASRAESEHDRVLTCQQHLNGDLHRLEATRIRLWPSSALDSKRVVAGAGMCLLVLIAFLVLATGHKPNTESRMNDTFAKGLAGGKEAAVDGDSGPDTVRSATETSNAQMPAPKTKSNIPSMAVAPFDVAQAKQHQQAWASHLGVPVEVVNSIGMKLALVPAGEFQMGSPESEEDRLDDEGPVHRVRITKPFYLGVYEVTQAEYEAVMGSDLRVFEGATRPAVWVSWDDAVEYCRKLSQKEGKKYRLPTEAEWEYACRAGTRTPFSFGSELNGEEANCDGNSPYGTTTKGPYMKKTLLVGSYRANGLGLYDMHGNVSEWCADWYDDKYYAASPVDDPAGPSGGSYRVKRGGSWGDSPRYCRAAVRDSDKPSEEASLSVGFRVAFSLVGIPAGKQTALENGGESPKSKSTRSSGVPARRLGPYDNTDREDAKMDYLRENAPMVIMGESLDELYKRHPDAKKGVLKKNPDGSLELQWGGGLASFGVLLSDGRVLVYRIRIYRGDRETAERHALWPQEIFGEPTSIDRPRNEPRVVSCRRWVHNGHILTTAVVMDRPFKGSDEYAYYSDLEVGDYDAVDDFINRQRLGREGKEDRLREGERGHGRATVPLVW